MTQQTAVLSLIRLARPTFRSSEDKLAYVVHAYVLAQGYKLVATGAQAEDPATDFTSQDREEVDASGWDSLPGVYAFRYQDADAGKRAPLFLKCIVAGPKLLVQWMAGGSAQTQVLELDIGNYTTESAAAPAAYTHAEDLMKVLDTGLGKAFGIAGSASTKRQQQQEQGTRREAYQEGEEPGPSYRGEEGYSSPLQESPPYYPAGGGGQEVLPPGIMPSSVGYEDVVPPGVRPPGYGGGYGGVGGIPAGPPHTGGGMHVGPGHPIFGPGKLGGGVGMPPEFGGRGDHGVPLPPGARWDPIGPPGTRGFRPDDFQQRRDPSHPHPDMAQPGPGKGTDWDQFFG
ncbi:hypothetical protein Ndes2526B_g05918 [Nannochloris sp. 'desiccata']|nr:putative proteasome inhibitor [Chlorella desiccata (nom. nud.)]